jgi:hypothetical protein
VTEVRWEIGKHDWSGGTSCRICFLERRVLGADEPTSHDGYGYKTGGLWGPVPTPCIPRLAEPIEGLFPAKVAHERSGLTSTVFSKRATIRCIRPAAITPNNVYLWRGDQLAELALDDETWETRRGFQPHLLEQENRPMPDLARACGGCNNCDDDVNYVMISEETDGFRYMIILAGDEVPGSGGKGTTLEEAGVNGLLAYRRARLRRAES